MLKQRAKLGSKQSQKTSKSNSSTKNHTKIKTRAKVHKKNHKFLTQPTSKRYNTTSTTILDPQSPSITQNTGYSPSKRKIVTNNVYENFSDSVGNTPLIKLFGPSDLTNGSTIWGKCEFMNPGGSVKDRAALYLIEDAEAKGLLTPGRPGIVLEATAGNTGVGLSLCANSKGYRTIIVIPETQTQEKKDTLRACGAYLIESPALPYKSPGNYVHVARRLSILLRKQLLPLGIPVYYPNQWDNIANARAHEETTAVEIYEQLRSIGKNIDGFNAAIGTGGTLVGTSRGLRKLNKNIKIGLTDPMGAMPYTYYTTGKLSMGSGSSITEGIGQSRITGNLALDNWKPNHNFEIADSIALNMLNQLNYEKGLQVGLSSGINVAGAIRLGQELGPHTNIVTMLCDNAMRYGSKMYNLSFLESKNLPIPYWMMENGNDNDRIGGIKDNFNISRFIQRDKFGINNDVNLLPEMLHGLDIDGLVKEAKENHDIIE